MNRVEKRRMQRETKKEEQNRITNEIWFNSLPLNRRLYIGNLIEQQTIQNDNLISAIMDKCFRSAMDDNLIASISDIRTIIKESNDYIADYKEYLDTNGYEEGFDMIENTELKEKVKVKIRQYISGKMQKAKALKLLKSEFNLPNAELSDLWLVCKDETAGKFDKSVIDKKMEVAEEMTVDIEKVKNEVSKADCAGPQKESKLQVVNVIKDIQGEYGTYVKSSSGVAINGVIYSDRAAVEFKEKTVMNEYKIKMEDLQKQMDELRLQCANDFDKYAELKQVFDM